MRKWIALSALALLMSSPTALAAATDWNAVDQAFGRAGTEQAGGVHRYGFPRSDLSVTLDGVRIRPALALGSWVAFHEMGDHVEIMGDLVLTQGEINPVLSRLLAGGLTITALHNHLLRSSPATMYMHIHGEGDAASLARTIRSALSLSATPLAAPAAAMNRPPPPFEDAATLDRMLGFKGHANGGVYQFSIPRAESISEGGMPVPASMGLATGINFQSSGDGKVAATGDFVLIRSEVTPVLQALRNADIEVTALHNHLSDEQPRLFFMHFWANGDVATVAQGLRAALDAMNIRPAS